jgi:hypothetical protein
MKYLNLLFFLGILMNCFSQGYKPKKSKKDFFGGAKDYRSLANYGLQVQLGPTYTFASKPQHLPYTDSIGNQYDIEIKSKGKFGVHFDIGMAHFNVKKPWLRIGKLYHYFDYGLNFKLFGGSEMTKYPIYDNVGREIGTTEGKGKFYNGYAGLRATIHYLKYFQNGSKFLDNGLGVNAEYMVLIGNKTYSNFTGYKSAYSDPLRIQLHYKIGFGFRLKRGSYLIPTIQIPILGFSQFGQESIHWFSSKYYPIMLSVKYIRLFQKKGNGCTDNGTEQDKKKNEEYMQGK